MFLNVIFQDGNSLSATGLLGQFASNNIALDQAQANLITSSSLIPVVTRETSNGQVIIQNTRLTIIKPFSFKTTNSTKIQGQTQIYSFFLVLVHGRLHDETSRPTIL